MYPHKLAQNLKEILIRQQKHHLIYVRDSRISWGISMTTLAESSIVRLEWLDWPPEPSGMVNVWGLLSAAEAAHFVSNKLFSGRRQIGQVDCFSNHTSMQERWKLWWHAGITRSTCLSSYSPKHIEHLLMQNNIGVSTCYYNITSCNLYLLILGME